MRQRVARLPSAWAAGILVAGCGASPPASVDLWIAGDVHFGTVPGPVLAPLGALGLGNFGFVNLEGPVHAAAPESTAVLRLSNHPNGLDHLRAAGVEVTGVANNHRLDFGDDGAARTIRALQAHGLVPAGGGAGFACIERHGLRVVIAAHDLADQDPAALGLDLRAARRAGDVLVASFHVTEPASYIPAPALRAAVDTALACGARVVAAHGTHALGPVERRGDAVIAWGLGNLAFACDCTDADEGLIVQVRLERDRCTAASAIPVQAGLGGAAARPAPDPAAIFDLLEAIGSRGLVRTADRVRW